MLIAHNNDYGWREIEEKLALARAQGFNMWGEYYPCTAGSGPLGSEFLRPEMWEDTLGYKYEDTLFDPIQNKFLTRVEYLETMKIDPGRTIIAFIPPRKPWLREWLKVPHMVVAGDTMWGTDKDGKPLDWDDPWQDYVGHPRTAGTRGRVLRMAREAQIPLMFTLFQLSYWHARHPGDAGIEAMQVRGRMQQGTAPDIGAKIAVCATILDEVGHAYHQGLLAERFGVDMHQRAFEDDIDTIWTWPIMEIPLRNYIEFVVMQALLDRAGLHWTKDIELHCSFAPYRRTLRKVNFEEGFHMRHGAFWTEFYWNHSPETREWVQKAVDWLFPFGVMWFGKPDDQRNRPDMLKYRVRGWGNDFMRDKWLQSASAFCDKLGIKIPAQFDREQNKWVLDMPYPMLYDAENYQWSWEECSQQEYWSHSRKGGPMRPGAYQRLRREEWGAALW